MVWYGSGNVVDVAPYGRRTENELVYLTFGQGVGYTCGPCSSFRRFMWVYYEVRFRFWSEGRQGLDPMRWHILCLEVVRCSE